MRYTLLQINVTANWGSTGKIAEQIGLLAMQQGWESYIAYGRMMNPSKSKLIKIGNQWDVYLHYALGRFLDMEGLASRRATQKLVKEIDKIKPTVVHLHNIHDHYLNYPILFKYLSAHDIPVVWTQHDQWAVTGGCCYIPDGCEKWKTGCFDCPLRKGGKADGSRRNFEGKKTLFTSLKSLTLVPVSGWLGGLMKESFLGDCSIKVIRNGIDISTFKPQGKDVHKRYGVVGKKIVLGVASVWDERKGLPDVIRLGEFLPNDDYAIVVVGKVLKKPEISNKDHCSIIFIDRTQDVTELTQLYTAASVLVNPTYQDNYPTTNLEAMACGTPVITYKTGGSPEAVTPETGMVVGQGDVEAMAVAVQNLNGLSVQKRNVMSEACRKRAEECFDKDKCFEKYVRLYKNLML